MAMQSVARVSTLAAPAAAGFTVLAAPVGAGEFRTVARVQEPRPEIGQGIGDRCGTGGRVVVELGARPIDVARMEETHQTIVGAVDRAIEQRRDVSRPKEAKSCELAHDLHVIIGKAEGWRFRRTAEPWPACLPLNSGDIHAAIIASPGRGKTR